jgi:hypothetical protein
VAKIEKKHPLGRLLATFEEEENNAKTATKQRLAQWRCN